MVDLSIANSGSLPEGRWRMFQCHVWWHQMSSYPMTGPISKFKWWLQKFGKDISKISPQFAFGIESRWSYIYIYIAHPHHWLRRGYPADWMSHDGLFFFKLTKICVPKGVWNFVTTLGDLRVFRQQHNYHTLWINSTESTENPQQPGHIK